MTNDYASLLELAIDSEPAHTIWRADHLEKLTLDQIQLVREERRDEFNEKFAELAAEHLIGSDLLADLSHPPIIVQARVLTALEYAARCVLFEEAVEEAGNREYDENFGEDDERAEQAYQRAKGETL